MTTIIHRLLLALALLLGAPAIPAAIQGVVITSASAGTYEDNVFPRGFPRWGSSPRFHEDRNRQYQGGMQQGGRYGQQSQGFGTVSQSGSYVHWRRFVGVRRVAAAPMVQGQPRARCGGGCATARPTCGTRCKPKCGTSCNTAATSRQANTAKVTSVRLKFLGQQKSPVILR